MEAMMPDSYKNSDPRTPIMQGSPPRLVPPRLDWDRAPWNRWSFQHVRDMVPTAEVWRGNAKIRDFPSSARALATLQVTGLNGQATTLGHLLDDTYTDGFLVLQKGGIVTEQYFNGMGPRMLHLSQSVAKSVTSAVAGILIGRGLIDVEARITDYLPELENTAWRGAKIQHVLDMTTGVTFSEEYTDPYSEMGQLDVAAGWKPPPPGSDPEFIWPSTVWDLILSCKRSDASHGAVFHYRSIETDVLAFAMERVTGKRLPQIVSEELWQKIGAEESGSFTVDSAGYALADGGFNATLRDYGRFGQMLLEGGNGIVPASWIEATRNGKHGMFGEPYATLMPGGAYHNMFWIENGASRNLMAQGVFGQLIYVDFANDMVVVKLSTWPDFIIPEMVIATRNAVRLIGQHLAE
jgi:CubicO group peptidase (beta-lactamase class C family)